MSRVAGIDGARNGWIVVTAPAAASIDPNRTEGSVRARFVPRLSDALDDLVTDHGTVVIDMPIGLPDDEPRPTDRAARARLGARRASFFPTPIRGVLDCRTWEEANALSRVRIGKGLSRQSWNLVPKICEVDRCWRSDLADTLFEGHPESSFAEMNGSPLTTAKSTPAGRTERLALLERHVSADSTAVVEATRHLRDAIDALALVWTARRIVSGSAVRLGSASDVDSAGRPMRLAI